MSCWKSRRSCSSRGLPRKQAHQGLSDATRPLLHIDLHADMPRHAALYTLGYLHTHTHIHTERGESSKLRRGFVPLMNLQRDSMESPFTYMYVINTTYYYYCGHSTERGKNNTHCSDCCVSWCTWCRCETVVVGHVGVLGKGRLITVPPHCKWGANDVVQTDQNEHKIVW